MIWAFNEATRRYAERVPERLTWSEHLKLKTECLNEVLAEELAKYHTKNT